MSTQSRASTRRDLRHLFTAGTAAGLTDEELLGRLGDGRGDIVEAALAALLDRHGPMVWATCLRVVGNHHAAEDAFQATFLALVRRGSTLRARESVGPWLHAVATRIALKSRRGSARRLARERRAAVPETMEAERSPAAIDDLGALVHQEVARLPRKYREPVVLCYFEGRTHDETAISLGWPVGTVRGRLARARDLLRSRLTRRGLAPDALLGAGLPTVAPFAIPPTLLEATIAVATRVQAMTPSVAALAGGAVAALAVEKIKAVATLVAVALLTVGAILTAAAGPAGSSQPGANLADQAGPTNPPASQPADAPMPADQPSPPAGTVVDPEGRPLAGVEVFLSAWVLPVPADGSTPTLARTTTDAQGRFLMPPPPVSAFKGNLGGTIWAYRPGLALGAASYFADRPHDPVRIQLDLPGRRVVTLHRRDGSPARGVKIAPYASATNSRGFAPDELTEELAQVSDDEGQVVFASLPRQRLPSAFHIWSGPGVQFLRPRELVKPDAAQVELVVEPAGALAGVVRRADGRSPAGLIVRLEKPAGRLVRLEGGPIRVGPDGTFRSPPVLLAEQQYQVVVQGQEVRPFASLPIEPAGDGRTATLGELVVEPLHSVTGRVVDRQGKPIAGAEVLQSGDGPERTTTATDADGRFRLGGYQEPRGLVFASAPGVSVRRTGHCRRRERDRPDPRDRNARAAPSLPATPVARRRAPHARPAPARAVPSWEPEARGPEGDL